MRNHFFIFKCAVVLLFGRQYAWMFNGRPAGGKVGFPKLSPTDHLPEELYFEFQKVNHFDGSDFRTWKHRYFMNNEFHKQDGPLFIMLGGESEANPVWLQDGAWIQYAREHWAMLVMLEHRYYGKSQPVSDLSSPKLQYLSSRQALADIALFIDYFREWYHLPDNKIVLFGGSYAGSLAAWFRSRYPYMVDGAVASSAPMVAVMEFEDYYVAVREALDATSVQCSVAIQDATTRMYDWWGQPDKRLLMQKLFRLCDKIDHDALLDLSVFFYNLAENFAGVVQYNNDNRAFEGAKGTNITIQNVCDIMTNTSRGDTITRYSDVNSLILDTYGEKCLNIRYTKLANSLNYTSWNSSNNDGSRQWLYQTCSEFGWIQSSGSQKQPFGLWFLFPWNLTTDQCIGVFDKIFGGSEVIDNSDETNRFYGGLDLPISNFVFVNGLLDPWRKVGVNGSNPLPNAFGDFEIFLVPGAAHCADMYPPFAKDPPEMPYVRDRISYHIGKWIN